MSPRKLYHSTVVIICFFSQVACSSLPSKEFDAKKSVETDRNFFYVPLKQDGGQLSQLEVASKLKENKEAEPFIENYWIYNISAVALGGSAGGFFAAANGQNNGILIGTILFASAIGVASLGRQELINGVEIHNKGIGPAPQTKVFGAPTSGGAFAGVQTSF